MHATSQQFFAHGAHLVAHGRVVQDENRRIRGQKGPVNFVWIVLQELHGMWRRILGQKVPVNFAGIVLQELHGLGRRIFGQPKPVNSAGIVLQHLHGF
jgi:hypothetical protein